MSTLKFVKHKQILGEEWNSASPAPAGMDETPHNREWKPKVKAGVIIPFSIDWLKKK